MESEDERPSMREGRVAALVSTFGGPGRTPAEGLCPGEDALARLSGGVRPPGAAGEALDRHLVACQDCRDVLAALAEEERLEGSGRGRASATVPGPGMPPTPQDAAADSHPATFGPYAVHRRVGSGGMGIVYEVSHPLRAGRREALKVLRAGLGADSQMAERFQREVRALSALAHDHVVSIYDAGRVGEETYYTMPLLPGASLSAIIDEIRATGERVPGAQALRVLDRHGFPPGPGIADSPETAYARRIAAALAGPADALDTMHRAGMVHRDVKPSNLVLDGRGRVVLTDFGVVRTGDRTLTGAGQMIGTPAYMSPEQFLRTFGDLDGRADVYGLGATLFEMLTLHLPHEGETPTETISLILKQRARSVRTLNPGLPADAETIVSRCLERRPADRYASAALLRDDLLSLANGSTIPTKPLSRTMRLLQFVEARRVPLAAAAVLCAAASGWAWTRPGYLTVASLPPAEVYLDGNALGLAPVRALRVPSGEHHLRLVLDGFEAIDRTLDVGRGGRIEIEPAMIPKDPGDPRAYALIARALDLASAEPRAERTRGTGAAPEVLALLPRGTVLEAPASIRLWMDEPVAGCTARLDRAGGEDGAPLAAWEPRAEAGTVLLEVPAEARRAIRPGTPCRVTVRARDGRVLDRAEFTLAEESLSRRVAAELRDLDRRVPGDHPCATPFRAEVLLKHGLFADAYDRIASLPAGGRSRPVPSGLALRALEGAGLRDRGPWDAWVEAYGKSGK